MLVDAKAAATDGRGTVSTKKRAGDRDFHYVLSEVYSALAHLAAEGEISSRLEDGVRYYSERRRG